MIKDLDLLGHKVKDRVSGFIGIVVSVSYDLSGCIQAYLTPQVAKHAEKRGEGCWVDTKRLERISTRPTMPMPAFNAPDGGEALPAPIHE